MLKFTEWSEKSTCLRASRSSAMTACDAGKRLNTKGVTDVSNRDENSQPLAGVRSSFP